jgi:hypothetical protein
MKTTHNSESYLLVYLSYIYTILVLNALYFSVRSVFWHTHYILKETADSKLKIKLFSLPLRSSLISVGRLSIANMYNG